MLWPLPETMVNDLAEALRNASPRSPVKIRVFLDDNRPVNIQEPEPHRVYNVCFTQKLGIDERKRKVAR